VKRIEQLLSGAFCTLGLASLLWGIAFSQGEPPESPINLTLKPGSTVKQGTMLLLHTETGSSALPEGTVAKLDGQTAKLFMQSPGTYETLMGISVDTKPGAHTVTLVAPNGTSLAKETFTVLDARFPKQNISIGKKGGGLKPLPGELEAVQALKTAMSPDRLWAPNALISPTPDCENSPFGVKRFHNGVYIHDYHKGVDLRSPSGRPIRAIADATVKLAAPHFRLHGGTVGLDHGQGLNSIYIHMSKVAVTEGQKVKKGETIGYVGSTGFATGPHLHWGLYANGIPVNPDQWIKVPRC
jgi:hypothetical protein